VELPSAGLQREHLESWDEATCLSRPRLPLIWNSNRVYRASGKLLRLLRSSEPGPLTAPRQAPTLLPPGSMPAAIVSSSTSSCRRGAPERRGGLLIHHPENPTSIRATASPRPGENARQIPRGDHLRDVGAAHTTIYLTSRKSEPVLQRQPKSNCTRSPLRCSCSMASPMQTPSRGSLLAEFQQTGPIGRAREKTYRKFSISSIFCCCQQRRRCRRGSMSCSGSAVAAPPAPTRCSGSRSRRPSPPVPCVFSSCSTRFFPLRALLLEDHKSPAVDSRQTPVRRFTPTT